MPMPEEKRMVVESKRWGSLIAVAIFVAIALTPLSARASSGAMEELIREFQQLDASINATLTGYSDLNGGISNRIVTEHIVDARVAISERRYKDAIEMLLMPAVSARFKHHIGQAEAQTLLARSLMREGYVRLARHFSAKAMDNKKGGDEIRQYAASIWLDASIKLKQFDNIEGVEGAFDVKSAFPEGYVDGARAELLYQYARALIVQGKLNQAIPYLSVISPESSTHPKAQYALAAALALNGKYEAAYALFYELTDWRKIPKKLTKADRKDLAEAANLACARVAMEMGKFKESWNGYSYIDKSSPYFIDAVYETIWLFETRGYHDESRNALAGYRELLPPDKRGPWAYILGGVLLQRSGDYDLANRYFEELGTRLAALESAIVADVGPLPNYIARLSANLIARGERALEDQPEYIGLLPGIETITAASLTVHRLNKLDSELRELDDEYKRLAKHIGDKRTPPIPEISDGYAYLSQLKNRLIVLRKKYDRLTAGESIKEEGNVELEGSGGDAYSGGSSRAKSLLAYIRAIEKKLNDFDKDIRARETKIAVEVADILTEERKNIAAFRSEATALNENLNTLIVETSRFSVASIGSHQQNLFMRTEYGRMETAWYAKEEVSKRADETYEKKKRALIRLANQFTEDLVRSDIVYDAPLESDAEFKVEEVEEKGESFRNRPIETIPMAPPILNE